MKNMVKTVFFAAIFAGAILFPHGANGAAIREKAAAKEAETGFESIEGKDWILLEVRSGGKTITLDREQMEKDNLKGAYTISFLREGRIGGMGAPNRYNAPYTQRPDKFLNIGNIASTMMLAFKEPEELKEKEYFDYLTAAQRWDFKQEKLEIYSKNSAGNEVILVFEIQ